MISTEDAINAIRFKLNKRRFKHSLRVAEAACKIARNYGFNEERAFLAGVLHDYARGLTDSELTEIARQNQLTDDESLYEYPDLLHGLVGAYLAQKELGMEDREILQAISVHTMGSFDMSDLDKIIFLADKIEPGRDYPDLERMTRLAFRNLDEGMLFGLESIIKYCLDQHELLHLQTVRVYNHFLLQMQNQEL